MANYTFLDAFSSVQTAQASAVSGTVLRPAVDVASFLSAVPTTFSGSPSISGAVTVIGTPSISGTVNTIPTGTIITSLVSTVPSSVIVGASIFGLAPVNVTNTNINISGSVVGFQGGTIITSLVSTVPSSVIVGTSIFGQLPGGTAVLGSVAALQGTNPWTVQGSVSGTVGASVIGNVNTTITSIATVGQVMGSIAALQGTNPWVVNFANSSILAVPVGSVITVPTGSVITVVQGSVAAAQSGTQITSVISANPSSLLAGVFAQRNDATASFLGGNLTWNPFATDSAGRVITKPFSSDDGTTIRFASSTVSTSVMLVQASAIGKRNYVTDFWFANTGASATLVTIKDGSTSVLAYTMVPNGGGSNSQGIHVPIRTAPSQDLTVAPATATSVLYVTVNGYQAP